MADTTTIATEGFFDPYDDGMADTTSVSTYGIWDQDSADPTAPSGAAASSSSAAVIIIFVGR